MYEKSFFGAGICWTAVVVLVRGRFEEFDVECVWCGGSGNDIQTWSIEPSNTLLDDELGTIEVVVGGFIVDGDESDG